MSTVLSADWVLPVEGTPIERGAVAIENGRIAAVGTIDELGAGEHYPGAVIAPGFVNAHSHLEYAVYAGFGDGLGFAPWLELHMVRKRRLDFDDMVASARLGAAQSLASGITATGDASFSGAGGLAMADLGLRGIVYLEAFGDELRDDLQDRVEPALSDRVQVGLSPHAPYTASPALYRACADTGLPLATHFAESPMEEEWLVHGGGPMAGFSHLWPAPLGETGIRALARAGVLSAHLVAAHCVTVDAEEIALLAEHGVAVAHCPRSNALLGCGVAPLAELRAAGIRVGLGTDSPASAPSFDMFAELRAALFAARARERRPDALSATEVLELATLGSARALGLDGEVGSLVPGKHADLSVVSLEGSPYVPWEDPAAALVFGGSPHCVITTLVDGEARYERGGFRWQELQRSATSARSRMLAASPSPIAAAAPR
jgi:cytosine/adenosine deaminase-related metal-dependent hydrolase